MANSKAQAAELLRQFKGDDYVFGPGCLDRLGQQVAACGSRCVAVLGGGGKEWGRRVDGAVRSALVSAGVELIGQPVRGARPNAPREDVLRIAEALRSRRPDVVLAVGGGSVIDAAKAAAACAVLGDDLDELFGVGRVSERLGAAGREMLPVVAAQLASGSAAHLTKYSNVTDLARAQKMLIVDDALVPPRAIFDYGWTVTMSRDFTMDGALDGVAHCLEVLMGTGEEALPAARRVCLLGIELIVRNLKSAVADGSDLDAREALGLGTDLGGCAIMIGGTNGAHLNSFSLVDLLPHGRACAVMNPYYAVLFARAIEPRLREVGEIYRAAGYLRADLDALAGRDLGLAVAEGMLALSRQIGFPTALSQVEGFSDAHVARCLAVAKDPKLAMKLQSMPVALSAENVDEVMGSVLQAAATGEIALVKDMG